MLVIYKGQEASCLHQNFDRLAIYRRKHRMETSETDVPNDGNSPKRKKMRLWNPRLIKLIICILTPFALLPLAVSSYKEAKCAYVIFWVAIYWMLEPVHIAVTALLPVALMPPLGIIDSSELVSNYMKEVLMMFLGGLGVAIAVEYCSLHERIALKVLRTIGTDIKWLMLGMMSTTMFLSMWISNTATTAMMVPIIDAMMKEINREEEEEDEEKAILHKTLLLSIAYSANSGGTGTITGTSPNMIFKGFMEKLYPESHEITYASWMAYNIPGMLLCVFAAWVLLQAIYIPWWRHQDDEDTKDRIYDFIQSRYEELGQMTFHEGAVLTLFVVLVMLWFFRDPKFMPGWSSLLPETKIGDSVPAIGILILLHLLPAEPWKNYKSPPLLTWKFTQEKMPWGLIILLGGGYALADGAEKSGLSFWLGQEMSSLSFLPHFVILLIFWIVTTTLTEIMSNSTVTSLMIPVVNQMAIASNINPLYLMLPVTIIASQSFMLPVATGPNAIVFSTGRMKTSDMIKAGLLMNFIAGCIQMFTIHAYGMFLFKLNVFPDWAKNMTVDEAKDGTFGNF